MEERIRVRIGTVLNDNRIDILSEDGDSLLHDLCRVIQQELDRAREEVVDDIWEEARSLASWDEHDGVIPIAQVENCLPEAMANIESKLTTK